MLPHSLDVLYETRTSLERLHTFYVAAGSIRLGTIRLGIRLGTSIMGKRQSEFTFAG